MKRRQILPFVFLMVVAVAVAAVAGTACSGKSNGASKTTDTTALSGGTSATTSTGPVEPVTDDDVNQVDQVLRRLDGELDRLDSDMATGEGETQQVVLDARKRAAAAAITRRVLALQERLTAAKSIARLNDADRSALTSQLQDQINGLTNLSARIQGDGNDADLRADIQRIVTDYRVYVLTIPKARGVVVADIELAAADRITSLADRLSTAIDQAKGDTTDARADLGQLRSKLTAVSGAVTPLPAGLLGLQPAGYPANRPVLEQTRQALRTGRAGLADAASLVRRVVTDLK